MRSIAEVQGSLGNDFDRKTYFNTDSVLRFTESDLQDCDLGNASKLQLLSDFSISVVFSVPNLTQIQPIVNKHDAGTGNQRAVNIQVNTNGSVTFSVYQSGTATPVSTVTTAANTVVINRIYHFKFVFEASTRLTIYLNRIKNAENTTSIVTGVHNSTRNWFVARIQNTGGTDLFGDINISQLDFYNKALSEDEVWRIHTHIGAKPTDVHVNIVGEYTFNPQYSRKIISGDAAIGKGLSINDLAIWDTCEQYNPSKVTPLVAQHGKLNGFSDNEVGTSSVEEATAIKDFYNNAIRKIRNSKLYVTANSMFDQVVAFTFFEYTQTFSIGCRIRFTSVSATQYIWIPSVNSFALATGFQRGIHFFLTGSKIHLILMNENPNGADRKAHLSNDLTLIADKWYDIIVTSDGTGTVSGIEININNKTDTTTIRDNLAGNTIIPPSNKYVHIGADIKPSDGTEQNFLDAHVENLEIIDSVASASDIEYFQEWGTFDGLGKTPLLKPDYNKISANLSDLSSSGYTINPFKSGGAHAIAIGDGTYKESRSLLSMMTQGLEVTAGKTIAFGNLGTINCLHFTFIPDVNNVTYFTATGITIKSDASNILSTTGLTNPRIFVTGFENNELSLDSIMDVIILFDPIAVNAFASNDNINFLIRIGAKSVKYTEWMVNLLNSNTGLANPFDWPNESGDGFPDNLDQYWLAQTGDISGANWNNKIPTGNTAVLTNFTIPTDIADIDSKK